MQTNDIVRVRVQGRSYLARVVSVNRKVRLSFISQVPAIDGSRRRVRSFSKAELQPHEGNGIHWTIAIGRR